MIFRLSPEAERFYDAVTNFIIAKKVADRPLIVGLNGVDGSGKTTMARILEQCLKNACHNV